MNLRQALLGCSTGQLGRIAAAWGVRPEAGALRRELVESLVALLAERVGDESVWAGLGPRETAALRLIARAGGRHEFELLTRRLVRHSGGSADDAEEARRLDAALAGLTERGLLFRVFEADQQRRGVFLLLPDEILAVVNARLGSSGSAGLLATLAEPGDVARCLPSHDLFVLASALRREAWNQASRGLAGRPARTVGQLLAALQQAEAGGPGEIGRRWRFLLWIGQRAGWFGESAWPVPDDDRVERLLAEPSTIPGLALAAGGLGPGPAGTAAEVSDSARLHADALQILGELTPGAWHAPDDVVDWLEAELGVGGPDPSDARDRRARQTRATLARWLAGRWLWLGLVAWGRTGPDWDRVAALPELGAIAQHRPPEPVHPAYEPCVVLDEARLRAPRGADLAALYRCERYLGYAGGGTGDREYRLTPSSFDRGVRLGGSADEFMALLGRLLQADVPPAWRDMVAGWTEGPDRLRLAARLLITADTDRALDALMAEPAAERGIEERLSARHAVVRADQLAELLTELARAGLPVEVDPAVRAEATNVARASALAGGVAEAAWVALEVLRRLAPEAVAGQRDLQAARRTLDATLPAATVELLERRATTIAAAVAESRAERRRPRGRKRVV